MTSQEFRKLIANGEFCQPTAGHCRGHVQCNMIVIPENYANAFEKFAQLNKKAIPVLEIVKQGNHSLSLAKGANLLNELPLYNIFRKGKLSEKTQDISMYYEEDFVFFLIGCSFTFETSLLNANILLRHIDEKKNVSMYNTNIKLNSVEMFDGTMVVSMRPIHKKRIEEVIELTSHFPQMHGSPIHIGCPEMIGIENIAQPDYGDFIEIKEDEIPVFWPCGVTPQNVLESSKLPFAITHSPGHMFVSDMLDIHYYE